jgi:hypothetical protein
MEEETRRNHRVKAIQLGDIYSDTADAKRAVPVLILVRHLLVSNALMCGADRQTDRRCGDPARGCVGGRWGAA